MKTLQALPTVMLNARYGSFEAPDDGTALSRSLRYYGEWSQADVDFLLRLIGEGSVVIDAAATVGAYTIPFAKRVGFTGAVHAFEASPSAEILRRNILHARTQNVSLYQATLDAQVRPVSPDWGDRESSVGAWPENEETLQTIEELLAPEALWQQRELQLNLDALDIARCDLIHLACQGVEWRALVGGSDLIDRTRPYISLECQDVGSAWTATALLLSRGYRAWLYSWRAYNQDNFKRAEGNIFGTMVQCSVFFQPAEREDRSDAQRVIGVSPITFVPVKSLHQLAVAFGAAQAAL